MRSTYAKLLHFKKVDPILIQIGGRWRSKAFLKYIRRDTTEITITRGISHRRKQKHQIIKVNNKIKLNIIGRI